MSKHGKKAASQGAPQRWKGDAVEDKPGDEAEQAAERAEGNSPVTVSEARERIEDPAPEQQPMQTTHRPRHSDDPEEEIAEAAEEHQERDAHEQPPRGKL